MSPAKQAERPMLSIKGVAERLDQSTKTIRRRIESGELVAYQLGRRWRIAEADLERFLRDRRKGL